MPYLDYRLPILEPLHIANLKYNPDLPLWNVVWWLKEVLNQAYKQFIKNILNRRKIYHVRNKSGTKYFNSRFYWKNSIKLLKIMLEIQLWQYNLYSHLHLFKFIFLMVILTLLSLQMYCPSTLSTILG